MNKTFSQKLPALWRKNVKPWQIASQEWPHISHIESHAPSAYGDEIWQMPKYLETE